MRLPHGLWMTSGMPIGCPLKNNNGNEDIEPVNGTHDSGKGNDVEMV